MDLRVYSTEIDPRIAEVLSSLDEKSISCDFPQFAEKKTSYSPSHNMPSWENSLLYESFFRLSCINGEFRISSYIRMNQGLLVFTIATCVLISRFFARSWLINLAVAALLLSRGRLIAANGLISGQGVMTCLITVWMCGVFHCLRSGSMVMGLFVTLFPFFLMSFDASLVAMGSALPVGLLILYALRFWYLPPMIAKLQFQRKRGVPLGKDSHGKKSGFGHQIRRWLREQIYQEPTVLAYSVFFARGGLFRSIKVPFLLFLQHHRLWKPIILVLFLIHGMQWGLALWFIEDAYNPSLPFNLPLFTRWCRGFLSAIDLDLWVAFLFIFATLIKKPGWGIRGFWEGSWFLLCSILAGAAGSYWWDSMAALEGIQSYERAIPTVEVLLWFEPVLLSFGFLCAINFIKDLSRKLISYY